MQDRGKHRREIAANLIVLDSVDVEAAVTKVAVSRQVITFSAIVCLSIEFYNQTSFKTDKIRNVGADQILTFEFEAAKFTVANLRPEQSFG